MRFKRLDWWSVIHDSDMVRIIGFGEPGRSWYVQHPAPVHSELQKRMCETLVFAERRGARCGEIQLPKEVGHTNG